MPSAAQSRSPSGIACLEFLKRQKFAALNLGAGFIEQGFDPVHIVVFLLGDTFIDEVCDRFLRGGELTAGDPGVEPSLLSGTESHAQNLTQALR